MGALVSVNSSARGVNVTSSMRSAGMPRNSRTSARWCPPASATMSEVMIRRSEDGTEREMTFLGPWETNVNEGIYAYTSGLGQSLMGKKVGDTVTLKIEGSEADWDVISLGNAVPESR